MKLTIFVVVVLTVLGLGVTTVVACSHKYDCAPDHVCYNDQCILVP